MSCLDQRKEIDKCRDKYLWINIDNNWGGNILSKMSDMGYRKVDNGRMGLKG